MAIREFEPSEAVREMLGYKLVEHLSEGTIHQISNDMVVDKI